VAISQSSYNSVNQLTNRSTSGGPVQFAGYLSKQATVTVAGNSATVNHQTTNFVGYASVGLGTNTVPVVATDYTTNQNSTTNVYQLVVTNNGVSEAVTYDANGNETSAVTATSTNTYQWDAENRLVSIIGPTNQSQFAYDGLGRRTQIIELQNGAYVSTNNFIWDGQTLVEQRDNTGTNVVKRFFGQGEQVSGTNYYFTRDHLGSVREVTGTSGTMLARYDYDPYGRMTVVSGSFNADFGYAGMYYHAPSGLNLTLYRAYNADWGRWINRDPIEENGGLNLYDYVRNSSINYVDPFGLAFFGPGFIGPLQPGDTRIPYPDPSIPGGPYTPSGDPSKGQFQGPKMPNGPRPQCNYVPKDSSVKNPEPYWKQIPPNGEPQRYRMNGDPVNPGDVHPGNPPIPWYDYPIGFGTGVLDAIGTMAGLMTMPGQGINNNNKI
jgi:RHS repeat-associated protein